jgi:hypothetical protein
MNLKSTTNKQTNSLAFSPQENYEEYYIWEN